MVCDDYGVDWDGPASSEAYYEEDVEVAETNSPLSQQQLDQLNAEFEQNCPINPSPLGRSFCQKLSICENVLLQCNRGGNMNINVNI